MVASSITEYVHGIPITAGRARRRMAQARAAAAFTASHLQSNAYSFIASGFFDAAAFIHSNFTGCVVTGLTFLFIEWRSKG